MTVHNGLNGRATVRLRRHEHVGTRRRTRRLAPRVIGLCLLMVLATFVFVVMPSPALASSSTQSSGLSTASTNPSPDVIPGTYVTFQCTHGTISLDGSQYCSHTVTAPINVCSTSPSCPYNMVGTVDSGYTFYGWTLSGQVSAACGTCLSTTLTVYLPNSGGHYTASVLLNTTPPPPPPPTVNVTAETFVNWSDAWYPAIVQACHGSTCYQASNGGILPLYQGWAYSVSGIALHGHINIWTWTTTAGTLSSNSSNPTTFTPQQVGVLDLIVENAAPGFHWAGYIYSPTTVDGTVTSASAVFTIPATVKSDIGIWVGIGGDGQNNLWQAGVDFMPGSPFAFYEACGPTVQCAMGGGGDEVRIPNFNVIPQDTLKVTVGSSGGRSTYSIVDETQGTRCNGSVGWTPNAHSAEWIAEAQGNVAGFGVAFQLLMVNGVSTGTYSPYIGGLDTQFGVYPSALAFVGARAPQFSENGT